MILIRFFLNSNLQLKMYLKKRSWQSPSWELPKHFFNINALFISSSVSSNSISWKNYGHKFLFSNKVWTKSKLIYQHGKWYTKIINGLYFGYIYYQNGFNTISLLLFMTSWFSLFPKYYNLFMYYFPQGGKFTIINLSMLTYLQLYPMNKNGKCFKLCNKNTL